MTEQKEYQMKKLNLTQWAAVAEIIGTAAVILSLLFVAHSINRNTAEIRLSNDTFLYQTNDSSLAEIAKDPEMAVFFAKRDFGLEFAAPELARAFYFKFREVNQWEQAFYWHKDGLFSDRQWDGWNRSFSSGFAATFPEEWWRAIKHFYAEDFAGHVEKQYRE
jgi:hypothetical protein